MVNIIRRYYKLVLLMIFFLTAIFYLQFVDSSKVVEDLGKKRVEDRYEIVISGVNTWLNEKQSVIEDSAKFIEIVGYEEDKILQYLESKLMTNTDFHSIYYLTSDNNMINASGWIPPQGLDIRNRPWYTKALEEKKIVFTDVFLNVAENNHIIGVAAPVFDEAGEIKGVVGGDIVLNNISSILNKSTDIPESLSFLINEKGLLISSSHMIHTEGVPFNEYINKSPNEIIFFNGMAGYFISDPIRENGWEILMFVPEKYIKGPINVLKGQLLITLLAFLISIFVFLVLQRKVIEEPLVDYEEKSLRTIQEEKNNFEALFKNSSDAIAILDNDNKIINVNEKFQELFLYELIEIKGKDIDELIVTNEKIHEAKSFTELLFKDKVDSVETIRFDKLKNPKEVEVKGIPIILEGQLVGGYASYTDISTRKAFEKEIIFMSYHDQLTGIYNRRYFEERIKELDKPENYPLSLIMADLNGLKLANDAFGHSLGDKLLIKTGEIILSLLEGDEFVARTGGDEFLIVMPKKSDEVVKEFINNISEIITETHVGTIDLSVSFGWATKTNGEEDIVDLMNKAESYMYKRKLSESPSMISNTIKVIIRTLHEKNIREKLHSDRVGDICVSIGKAMGFDNEELNELKLVGLMHDIGKIGIDENILNKEGKLTEDEYEEIKKHPEIGYRILSSANQMSDLAEYTLAHHERWDGKGYPNGIKGEEIPFVSRIIAIADAYDAMTSKRTYRGEISSEEAALELRKNAGTQFDPEIVNIFIEKVLKL